jgi:hypothetical protein
VAFLPLPPDRFPKAEAQTLVAKWGRELAQLTYGARRESCHWNYTLPEEREHVIDVLLPDAARMRTWSRLLALHARLEILDRHYDKAAETIATGIALGRHVGSKPFLVNAMFGTAAARIILSEVEEFVSQPDAPNLYWCLTALPRPLIPIREGLAHEYKLCEWLLPEMTDLEEPRTEGEWSARLGRFQSRLVRWTARYQPDKPEPGLKDLDAFRAWVLPDVRQFFDRPENRREGLVDDQKILMYYGKQYRIVCDAMYKASHLPFFEAQPFYAEAEKLLIANKKGPLKFFSAMTASVESGHQAQAVLDRNVAALRVVEALRLHAGSAGSLPSSLEDVKVAPIPIDPVSGKPFEYHAAGRSATLSDVTPKGPLGLIYRIVLRK